MKFHVFAALASASFSLFVASPVQAQPTISSLFAVLAIGMLPRNTNDDYARKIDVDPKASVRFWDGNRLCSGTFVSTDTAVTAAHCVDLTDPTGGFNVEGVDSLAYAISDGAKNYLAELNGKQARPANLPPLSNEEIEEINAKALAYSKEDIAIIRFPKGTGEFLGIARYPAFAKEPLAKGDQAYLVAFGGGDAEALLGVFLHTPSGTSQGIKGWGTVKIESVDNGVYQTETVEFTPDQLSDTEKLTATKHSVVLPGDSGGSVFNDRGELVAVNSSVYPHFKIDSEQITPSQEAEQTVSLAAESRLTDLTGSLSQELLGRAWSPPEDADKNPFSHSPLRSGRYIAPQIKGDYLLLPAYKKGKLVQVSLRTMDKGQPGAPAVLKCLKLRCLTADKKVVLKPDGKGFTMGLQGTGLLSVVFPEPQHVFHRID